MKKLSTRALLISSAVTPALVMAAVPARAQQVPATPAAVPQDTPAAASPAAQGDIVVTGIRQSLERARDIKRDSTQFVDAIVADDIGKLPDTNVAESLARVSGVQVDRGVAAGTDISIRGLRQNVILFNGREIYDATGRGGTGLDQLGSSTYGLLALVPSELISRLEVTKLPAASQVAGALGGIVDINTRMPLDGPTTQIAAKATGEYADAARKGGYSLFGLASHKFANDTLGVLLSASYEDRNLSQQGLDTYAGYTKFTDADGNTRYGDADVRPEEIQENRTKLGLDGVVQWKPRDGVEITADSFYSKLTSHRDRYWLSFNPTLNLSNATYSDNDILLSGTSTGSVLTNVEYANTKADIWSSALRGKFDITDHLKTSAEISYDRSTSSYRQIYFRLQPNSSVHPSVDFDLTSGDFGAYSISGIDLTDPSQLNFTILFDQLFRAKTDAFAARSDWTMSFDSPFLKSIDYGFRYTDSKSRQNPLRADIRPTGGIPATALGDLIGTYSNDHFLTGDFDGLPRTYLIGSSAVTSCHVFTDFPAVSQNAQCLDPASTTNSLAGTFTIKERFTEGYGKVDFDTPLGASTTLSGNIGVRYVNRYLDSIGNQIDPSGAAVPTDFKRTDNEWLPSAVAKIAFGNDFILRAGAAKVVAFPNTQDLNNGLTLSNTAVFVNGVQVQPGTGSGGAPNLDPFKANQVDVSAEYYFGRQAMVSLGLFYKDVSTFIVQEQSPETYAGVEYLINRKVNGDSAKIKGAEALLQLPFYFLPHPLDGFGIVATYSYIDSSTPTTDVGGRKLPFPGLSKNNVNLIGYYERGPLSVRLAYNWRDDYLYSLSVSGQGIYNSAYSDLSATVRYDITPGVSIEAQALNLLDSRQRTYDGVDEALRTNVAYGRIFKASIGVKF
ncbi:TonB-dependent receptor [Hephaestia mangrovi]|uniref:TonB-dependent receptor n=1 Tax=Hephaestia mangrovi TaxID=2873268 RepID=UPI001CA6CF2C|nr:TonB-dependent receptor [Hephaestia mangrovi]MBY8829540.1 TonB-dependent receptor [Hephaestia mangrovi]